MTDVSMIADVGLNTSCTAVTGTGVRCIDATLHPLVIMNISEHWTRVKAQSKDRRQQKVYGAILGKLNGRKLEMINSFELRMYTDESNGSVRFNEEFFRQREAQYKEVFPELEHIGWYCTGESLVADDDITIHRQFTQFIESPVLVKLDPNVEASCNKLPLVVLESAGAEASSTAGLKSVDWTLISEESERIGIDHVTRLSTQVGSESTESEMAKQMRSNGAAVNMLIERIKMIHDYLVAVKEDRLPRNDDIIREANKLCQRLPLLQPSSFDSHFDTQEKDANAALLLTKMTEMCGSLSQLVTKVNLLTSDRSISGMTGSMASTVSIPVPSAPLKKSHTSKERTLHGLKDLFASAASSSSSSHPPDLFPM